LNIGESVRVTLALLTFFGLRPITHVITFSIFKKKDRMEEAFGFNLLMLLTPKRDTLHHLRPWVMKSVQ
jgi:hypothetical protein